MTNERLFDVGPYGGDDAAQLRSRSRERVELPVEELAPGWRWIRSRNGVLPYAHLIKAQMNTEAVLTLCNKVGTTLSNDHITQMVRCPECDIAQQLA